MWKAWVLIKLGDSITYFLYSIQSRIFFTGLCGVFILILAACSAPATAVDNKPDITFYLPPTVAVSNNNKTESITDDGQLICTNCNTPVAGSSQEILTKQPQDCLNNLLFMNDITIPDGTQVVMGENLDKRWRVKNVGTCNWDKDYRIKLVAGPALGAITEQALFPARSKLEATIRMKFITPDTPGSYRSAWQAYSPQGDMFGDPFFIEIVVSQNTTNP